MENMENINCRFTNPPFWFYRVWMFPTGRGQSHSETLGDARRRSETLEDSRRLPQTLGGESPLSPPHLGVLDPVPHLVVDEERQFPLLGRGCRMEACANPLQKPPKKVGYSTAWGELVIDHII